MKMCCYCHLEPRRANSPYCCAAHAAIKRAQNRRNQSRKRAQEREARRVRREAEAQEAERIYQHAEYAKRKARRLLREDEPPHRLAPVVTVTKWNIKTDRVYEVRL